MRSIPTPCRSMPIAAPAVLKQPSWSNASSKSRARELGMDPTDLRKKNFVKQFRYQTAVASLYDAGDYQASLTKALEITRLQGFRQAQARQLERHGKLRGIGFCDLHRGVWRGPVVCWSAQLGAGVGLWNPRKCASIRRVPLKC